MAIIETKNKKEEKKDEKKDSAVLLGTIKSVGVLKQARITEKASFVSEKNNVFIFEIAKDANKKMVMDAVKDIYKVSPVRVNIAKTPSKNVWSRGKMGVKSGVKKAYVFLKKGDKIEIM